MSKVFNMVGGGGGKNISSIIITGLESTDTVTCAKDGKSYTATWDETAQHWEIIGLPLGTFTVTATNGTKTITETVLIDISGIYEIYMSFRFYLYNNGENADNWTCNVTSSNPSGAVATKNSRSITLSSVYYAGSYAVYGYAYTNIDLTDYSILHIVCDPMSTNASSSAEAYAVGSIENVAGFNTTYDNFISGDISIDISGYTGEQKLKLYFYAYHTGVKVTTTAEIVQVWLE